MSKMTAKEYAKQYKRMCKTNIRKCTNCPLYNIELPCEDSDCRFALYENSDKAIEIVSKWAEEHPERTYKQDFIESYPEAKIYALQVCDIHGINACKFPDGTVCNRCPMWDEPMPEVQE